VRLSKLSFKVHRAVDLRAWLERGETLLDRRKPPFNGPDLLPELATKSLLFAWREGTETAVAEAMKLFLREFAVPAASALVRGATLVDLGEWFLSTEHISVRYGIQFEGVDIANLSPGTRGVVLLALYLGLDETDRRPLVIDQPEENLDPRSVFTQLAPYFRAAARRRQVIMVTHNANLVVNTDSDQVIVAEAERLSAGQLPRVTYVSGGLEDLEIRAQVCKLLEGGGAAFANRSRRYGALVTSDE
jgi:hypothetical protein